MARDLGGFFDKLTKAAKGGRRSGASGGSLSRKLQDLIRSGRSSAETVRRTVRDQRRTGRRRPRKSMPSEGVVTIEYTPSLDGDPDPGEVVWAWVPFEEDPTQGKDRPVVVIGRRDRSLVGVPLTTRRSDREAQIAIGAGDWDSKRRQSYARIWKLIDIDPGTARREGAVLERSRFDDVIEAVDLYYDVRR